MGRIATADLLAELTDEDTWRSWDAPVTDPDADPAYLPELVEVRERTGIDESVTTGSARVAGQSVAVIASDFDFLAGSVGVAAAARIVAAFERATALGLPVLGLPTSGGTRLQEGTTAFLRMASIAGAARAHTDAGLPYLVYLRHPTTGGVMATWGSLGDVTGAQPGALTGFLGPRVYEGLYGRPFPPGVQTAEGLAAAGVIDTVADPAEFRDLAAAALRIWRARPDGGNAPPGWETPTPQVTHPPAAPAPNRSDDVPAAGWDVIRSTRESDRPGAMALLATADDLVVLSGTGAGETAHATTLALARFDEVGAVFVVQDAGAQAERRSHDPALGIGPADLRVARRGMALARRWGLPLVTVVDTQGAELSEAAESGALAGEIARCLSDLSALATPTLSVLWGGGGGGGALALLPADRVVAAVDGWVTPLPVEGAALIRYRTTDQAAAVADAMGIRAVDLAAAGAVDRVVGAPVTDTAAWRDVIAQELSRLVATGPAALPRRWPSDR